MGLNAMRTESQNRSTYKHAHNLHTANIHHPAACAMQRRELRALMCDRPSRNRFRSFCASELCIESFAFAADVADYTSKPCLAAHLTQ